MRKSIVNSFFLNIEQFLLTPYFKDRERNILCIWICEKTQKQSTSTQMLGKFLQLGSISNIN